MKYYLLILLAGLLLSCTTLPVDTLNKRLTAFEITYEEMLNVINKWIETDQLDPAQLDSIKSAISKVKKLRAAIYEAKDKNLIELAIVKLNEASEALKIITEFIAEKEKVTILNYNAHYVICSVPFFIGV